MPDTPSRSRGRSDKFIRNTKAMIDIDRALRENEDSDFLQETKKAKTNAELERIFPGVSEDEKTRSGMYEPALHNYPSGENVYRSIRPDVADIDEFPSPELTVSQQLKILGESEAHYAVGTGPRSDYMPRGRASLQQQDSDYDFDTPDFGTDRTERDYAGFEQGNIASDFPIGSEEYWNHLDTYSITSRENARLQPSHVPSRHATTRITVNTSRTGTRATNYRAPRQAEVVRMHDRATVTDRISQAMPFAAGSTRTGRRSFRGALGAPRGEGQLPRRLSPRGIPDYTVYSRDTPIAWRSNEQGSDVWHVPNVNYSSSSSNHQNIVRRALSNTHVSTVDRANQILESERLKHREQGIHLPAKTYRISKDLETFHRRGEDGNYALAEAVSSDVQSHFDTVLTPAVQAHKLTRGYINRKNREYLAENQFQLPLGEGDTD